VNNVGAEHVQKSFLPEPVVRKIKTRLEDFEDPEK